MSSENIEIGNNVLIHHVYHVDATYRKPIGEDGSMAKNVTIMKAIHTLNFKDTIIKYQSIESKRTCFKVIYD